MRLTSRKNRILSMLLVASLAITMCYVNGIEPAYAGTDGSKVIIGHARSGENGLRNNKAGDQTGNEVSTMAWVYSADKDSSRHWTVVARCNSTTKAKKIAQVIKDACENDHVGYDRGTYTQRQSFFTALKAANFDASKITKDVETTCTPLIAAAVYASGINIKTDYSASGLYKALKATGKFTFYTTKDYVASDENLVAGDILLSTGNHQHGATVVSSPNSRKMNAVTKKTASESKSSIYKAGKEYVTNTELNVRYGPGKNYKVKKKSELTVDGRKHCESGTYAVLEKGTTVTCVKASGNWICIPSGWICGKDNGEAYVNVKATVKKNTKTSTKLTIKVGKDYKLKTKLLVRTGPGKDYSVKKKSQLSASARIYAVESLNLAQFKKGTVVTCLKKKGDWMMVPSGWICCKPGNLGKA